MHAAIVGTYPPTRCGIATFTADVESSLHHNGATTTIVPVEPGGPCIDRDSRDSYVRAARHLNDLGCDVVVIEHEFGIFGGVAGSHILALAGHLTVPYVVTLHTVLPSTPTINCTSSSSCAGALQRSRCSRTQRGGSFSNRNSCERRRFTSSPTARHPSSSHGSTNRRLGVACPCRPTSL